MIDFDIINGTVRDVFGETVIVRRAGVPDIEVQAIYDSRHYADEGELSVSTRLTSVTVRSDDLGEVSEGDTVIARGVTYTVWEPRLLGQGMVTLPLVKADYEFPMVAFDVRPKVVDDYGNPVEDEYGNPAGGWAEQFVVAATYIRMKGSEAVLASRLEGLQPTTIRVAATADTRQISTNWRARDTRTGETFNILGIAETLDQEWIEITATSGGAAG